MFFTPGTLDDNGNVIPDTYYASSSEHPEKGYFTLPFFKNGVVANIEYMATTESGKMYLQDAVNLLTFNSPKGTIWSAPMKNVEGTEVDWNGSVNGNTVYTAHLNGTMDLSIHTIPVPPTQAEIQATARAQAINDKAADAQLAKDAAAYKANIKLGKWHEFRNGE